MIEIRVPNSSYSKQSVTLGDEVYTLYLKFNVRNESWYITIKDSEDSLTLLGGVKLMPNQDLTTRYRTTTDFEGHLLVLRNKNTPEGILYGNLGIGKAYSLYWVADSEFKELGINGRNTQF